MNACNEIKRYIYIYIKEGYVSNQSINQSIYEAIRLVKTEQINDDDDNDNDDDDLDGFTLSKDTILDN